MWWQARDETESSLIGEVYRLYSLYQEGLHIEPDALVLRGVGAGPRLGVPIDTPRTPGLAEEWHPLVLIDDRSVGRQQPAALRFSYSELDQDSLAAQVLRGWQLTAETLIEPVGPIVAAVSPGDVYNGSNRATVGLPVTINPLPGSSASQGFLTVAHGVGAVNTAISISTANGQATGKVTFRDESARTPKGGDDIALVALDPPFRLSGWLINQGAQQAPQGPPYARIPVDLFGGLSGSILAQVSGVLLQMGGQTRQWLDCWELGVT